MPSTYEPIATTTVAVAAASITFSSIAGTYTDLRLVINGLGLDTAVGYSTCALRFNGDTGSNYSYTRIYGDGTSATSDNGSNMTSGRVGYITTALTATDMRSLLEVNIFSYAGSTNKTTLSAASNENNVAGINVQRNVMLWRSTSAITSITAIFTGGINFAAGTTATLYGIKNA